MNMLRFIRISRLLGDKAVEHLSGASVLIVGLGAVGGFAMEALARSGVGHFKIVDFDTIGLTNINRQLLAGESTLGKKKVEAAKARILDINSAAAVDTLDLFAHEDTLEIIFDGKIDIVIDAIDSLTPKLALLEGAYKRKLPIISSMGAALRLDPSLIRSADLMDTNGCPLAKQVRTKLKRRNVGRGITAVFSTEPVVYDYKEPEDEQYSDLNEQILDRGRPRKVLGSLPTVTGMFGLRVAHEAIMHLIRERFEM